MPGTAIAILDHRGLPVRRKRPQLRATYDAARTNQDNRRHWANADGLSATYANSPEVRRALRMRSRYEVANNSYARGIICTLGNDTIGTGPFLQVRSENEEANNWLEQEFCLWAGSVGLAEKLRLLRMAKAQDGEAFCYEFINPQLQPQVKMDLGCIEADQIATPGLFPFAANAVDGIVFDDFGNPVEYHVLKQHPGDMLNLTGIMDYTKVDAKYMVHLQRLDRPGQRRAIPEITPALSLFAELRRFTQATIRAAETAADHAGVLHTDASADTSDEDPDFDGFDAVEIEKGMMVTLPRGYDLSQFKAEHPATTYEMFVKAILKEIARCLNMPYNIAAGDSSSYNYASGRMDHQTYFKSIKVERDYFEKKLLRKLFIDWLQFAVQIFDYVPAAIKNYILNDVGIVMFAEMCEWLWVGNEHVDPSKDANADDVQLKNKSKSHAEVQAARGKDWVKHFRQIAREQTLAKELGIELFPETTPATGQPANQGAMPMDESMMDTTLEKEEVYVE